MRKLVSEKVQVLRRRDYTGGGIADEKARRAQTKFERDGGGSVHFEAFWAEVTRALSRDPECPMVENVFVGSGLLLMRFPNKHGLENEIKNRGRAVGRMDQR